jgi:hypothetical protein
MVGSFKDKLNRAIGIGKRAIGHAARIGKTIYRGARTVLPIAKKVGDIAAQYGGALAVVPEFGPQLAQGVTNAGIGLSKLAGIGNSLLDKGDAAYDKGVSIYNGIKGEAARQGLTFGSSDVSGMRTTPPNWSSAHESKSNKSQKNYKIQPISTPAAPSAPIPSVSSVTEPAAAGSKVATGPMVGMSSEYTADTVAQDNRKRKLDQISSSEPKSMYERYQEIKSKAGRTG